MSDDRTPHDAPTPQADAEITSDALESVAGGTDVGSIVDGCTMEPIRCWDPPTDPTDPFGPIIFER